MKFHVDKKYLKICMYAFFTVAALMVLWQVFEGIGGLLSGLRGFWDFWVNLLMPFIIGSVMAYLLNPLVNWIEKLLLRMSKRKKISLESGWRRMLSIVIVFLGFIAILVVCIAFIIPTIQISVSDVIKNGPAYIKNAQEFLDNTLYEYEIFENEAIHQWTQNGINQLLEWINSWFEQLLLGAFSTVITVVDILIKFAIGAISAFYILREREMLSRQLLSLFRAIFKNRPEHADRILDFFDEVEDIFGRYVMGKMLESFILSSMYFILFTFLRIPNSMFLGLILGFSNLIPYVGPIIGVIPVLLITLYDNAMYSVYVLVALTIFQALDAYIIGPWIFGDRLGLSPFWIIFSMTIGGGLFGFAGMFLGLPIAAVVRLAVKRFITKSHETGPPIPRR